MLYRKSSVLAAFVLSLLICAGCEQTAGKDIISENVTSQNTVSQETAAISEDAAETQAAVTEDTSTVSEELPTEETTDAEIADDDIAVIEGDDEIVAVDEGEVYEDEENSEQALQIKDVKDDNASLPFETDVPIFAFDTDYTLYNSETGNVRSGAIDAIKYLVKRGFKWCIISVDYENSKEGRLQGEILGELNDTDSYLGFYVVNSGAERYQWCIENGADVLVDDNEKTASLADQACFHTLLVDADDDIAPSLFLHPMGNGSSYGGFNEYVDMIYPK